MSNLKQELRFVGAKIPKELYERMTQRKEFDRRSLAQIINLALENYLGKE